jgi:hypothetical protein
MNVPIRILSIATSIFWIILVAFIASAAYSMKDLGFGVGKPQFTTTPDNDLLLTLPLFIDNRGYYSLNGFNLTTVFSDAEGTEISRASTLLGVIPQGQNSTILYNVTFSMDSIAERANKYVFEDGNLTCAVSAGLNFAEIVPTQLATNVTFPWGAPFYNFKLGQTQFIGGNLSHIMAKVPLSFENHAAFNLSGNIRVKFYGVQDALLGETQTDINAPEYSSYSGNLAFSIPVTSAISSTNLKGHFEVHFSTPMFEYEPLVIPYG